MALFTKVKPIMFAHNELIGKKIADIYDLLCPKYYLHDIDGYHVEITSEDIGIWGTFKNSLIFSVDGTNLYDIINHLDLRGYDSNSLIPDLLKMYTIDILFSNCDRSPDNWGIVEKDGKTRLVIFDNELLFSSSYAPFVFADPEDLHNYANGSSEDVLNARLKDIETFLFTYDSSYTTLFRNLVMLVPPEKLESIFAEVEGESKLPIYHKEYKLDMYKKTYAKVYELLIKLDSAMERK